MKVGDLRHGDVLMFEYRRYDKLIPRAIRLVTGSHITHVGIVQEVFGVKVVLEQLSLRTHTLLNFYPRNSGEKIEVARPNFNVPKVNKYLFIPEKYGYWSIVDCLINHALGQVPFLKWEYRPFFTKWTKTRKENCSNLVAHALDLSKNVPWCKFPDVVEPDDFYNHTETFTNLGTLEWEDEPKR